MFYLTKLDCSLSPTGIVSVVDELPLTLVELALRDNNVGDEGLKALTARLPRLSSLEKLDIRLLRFGKNLSHEVVYSLIDCLPQSMCTLYMHGLIAS